MNRRSVYVLWLFALAGVACFVIAASSTAGDAATGKKKEEKTAEKKEEKTSVPQATRACFRWSSDSATMERGRRSSRAGC